MPVGVLLLGLPWTPMALIAWSRSARETWPADGRAWVVGWFKAALACIIAGGAVPGLGAAARVVAIAGLMVVAAAGLDAAWKRSLAPAPRRTFFAASSAILALWLVAMILGSFIWIVSMPYYRVLGIIMAVLVLVVATLGWSALGSANTRRGVLTMAILAAGLKLAYWGYYAPEWNYRFSQGPWGRAIGQWIPRKWPVYTFNDWLPPDLAFFIGRPVLQLPSPRFLDLLPGPEARYILLQASEFENWPDRAPRLTTIARLQDRRGEERILARTPGLLPAPGQKALRSAASPQPDDPNSTPSDD
jgi:hypothetical protein